MKIVPNFSRVQFLDLKLFFKIKSAKLNEFKSIESVVNGKVNKIYKLINSILFECIAIAKKCPTFETEMF